MSFNTTPAKLGLPVLDSTAQDEEHAVKVNEQEEKDEILVEWDGDNDPENPQNWSTPFKTWATIQLSLLAFAGSLASSIISPASKTIAEYVGVSQNVVVLIVSLYMYVSLRVAEAAHHAYVLLLVSDSHSALSSGHPFQKFGAEEYPCCQQCFAWHYSQSVLPRAEMLNRFSSTDSSVGCLAQRLSAM
jgi:hypothetical protein